MPTTTDTITGPDCAILLTSARTRAGSHANAWRQRLVVELALHTGAKVGELTTLTCGDVRLLPGHETLRIRSRNAPRVLPLTAELASALREYLRWKEQAREATGSEAPLVCSQRGGALTLRGWQDAWLLAQRHARLIDRAGKPLFSLESAREHAGRRIYTLRENPHDVQAWLGLALSSNADRFRPQDLDFNPVCLRALLEPKPGRNSRWPTNASHALLIAAGYFNGTAGVMDRYEARRRLLALPDTDPLAQYWIARCLERGRAFFPRNHDMAHEKAVKCIGQVREMAETGDVMAMYLMGSEYTEGISGVPIDHRKSLDWYLRAAEKGHETSLNNIGLLYEYGLGVERDSARAMEYFRHGASLHEGSAMFNLAVMLAEGIGCVPDLGEALTWYKKAASIGEVRSMNNLSYYYRHGIGVPKDPAAAERWYCHTGQLPHSPHGYVRPTPQPVLIRAAG